eukprot:TRINITY_DN18502_c0_g1_i1.p1 TRINITY_DN18502_c0_g1~~TRINITY_DN18502_c0_g1_i1.p1  ORF type:complete len:457 (+),score=128.23 TRINITY_DN18502_c0_g1_i1:230-1600(+)
MHAAARATANFGWKAAVVASVVLNITLMGWMAKEVSAPLLCPVCQQCSAALAADGVAPVSASVPTEPAHVGNVTVTMLFCVARFRYEGMMDRWFFELWKAATRDPRINADLWGPGFDGWDRNLSAVDNLRQRLRPREHVMILYSKRHCEPDTLRPLAVQSGLASLVIATVLGEASPMEGGMTASKNSATELDAKSMFYRRALQNATDLVFFNYACDMAYYSDIATDKLLVHLPHAAPPDLFYGRLPNATRPIDVLITGSTQSSMYPFRNMLLDMVKNGEIAAKVLPHPGYTEQLSDDVTVLHRNGITANSSDAQLRAYADTLKTSKIVLCTRPVRQLSLRKYTEAAMAGALVIGNIPLSDRSNEFREYVVEIDQSWPRSHIAETIRWWLEHDEARLQRAAIGQNVAVAKYTTERAVARIYAAWHEFVFGGRRGMLFPHEFRCNFARPWMPRQRVER